MTNPIYGYVRRNIRNTLSLLPFVILALLGAFLLFHREGAVSASQLFQSPVPPVEQPAPPARPTPERVLPPPTVAPPPSTATPIPPPTSPPAQPPATLPPQQPVQPPPSQPEQQPAPPAPGEPPPEIIQPPNPVQPAPANPGQSEIVVDSGLLIDSLLVYVSYVWLCCGVVIFILIPVLFLVLYVWGSQRARNADM